MRRFRLRRLVDESGVSGEGCVAQGVVFFDGTCALRWMTQHRSTALYDSFDVLMAIHGHGGKTQAEFEDEAKDLEEEVRRLRAQKDAAYSERNKLVALLARMAPWMGWASGRARHPEDDAAWERDWMTIAFVDLPTGQASWHFHDSEQHLLAWLPKYLKPWDGHSTEEKYRRVDEALMSPCILADHECPACGRNKQPCSECEEGR